MPYANAGAQPVRRRSSLIALGATLGLVYGYLEAAEDGSVHVYALSDRNEDQDLSGSRELADSVSAWLQRYGDEWANPERRR